MSDKAKLKFRGVKTSKEDTDGIISKAFAERIEVEKERNAISKKKLCIELARARIQYARDLMELGIYSSEEINKMLAHLTKVMTKISM